MNLIFKRSDLTIVVASPAHILVIPLRALTKCEIVLDAGWPLSDSNSKPDSIRTVKRNLGNLIIDWLSFKFANKLIFESQEQIIRVAKNFHIEVKKMNLRYTGFAMQERIPKPNLCSSEVQKIFQSVEGKFVVLFRGKDNAEAGLDKILEISIELHSEVVVLIACSNLTRRVETSGNVIIVSKRLTNNEIACLYSKANLCIGQLGNSARLEWTIPHKFFEAASFGVPYISTNVGPLTRICKNGEINFFTSTIVSEMAKEIDFLLLNKNLRLQQSNLLRKLEAEEFSTSILRNQFKKSVTATNHGSKKF